MSDQPQHKNKSALSPHEAAALLRRLAEQLEQGILLLEGQQVRMDHALVLEQSLKAEDGGLSYRLKLKYKPAAEESWSAGPQAGIAPPAASPAPTAAGQPSSFKEMKKALAGLFKQAQAALGRGDLPSVDLARGLSANCQQLLSLPQAGGPGFQELAQQAQLLLEAVEKGDAPQAGQAAQAMGRIKSTCHAARR